MGLEAMLGLCSSSAFQAERWYVRPRQTSSFRSQSGVTELMSFQDGCATTIDAGFIARFA